MPPLSITSLTYIFHPLNVFLALVQKHGHDKVKSLEGTVQEVLVEEVNEQDNTLVSGKLENNVTVHFPGDKSMIGKIVDVRLNCCKGFYFIGEIN